MTRHFVDLHIHSKYSRATSKALEPETLTLWGGLKGLSLIGTGDMTHPAWLKELGEKLARRDDGFYSLKDRPEGLRFVPAGEVSAIYKQDGRTRKIHLLVIAPDLAAAERFSKALGARGNVESDGRPILGLTARQILEIAKTASPEMMVAPAHIWTPWFSLFGSQSGFDRLEDCFGDLSPEISALETGLSSDPAMNRLVSALDRYPLISSSDAHSPDKLGREATIINGALSWDLLKEALRGGPALGGTVEFFPEEGKYHLDGHVGCGPALAPADSKAMKGLCPVCGRPLTIGVLHRVMDLADRTQAPAELMLPDHHLVPLAEILGQTLGVGPKSLRVGERYRRLLREFGSEFAILLEAETEELKEAGGPLLALAVEKMRQGRVEARGGFDGQYGVVEVVSAEERAGLSGQGRLFESAPRPKAARRKISPPAAGDDPAGDLFALAGSPAGAEPAALTLARGDLLLDALDAEQRQAVISPARRLAVTAGPGAGKTRVLVHRAAWLLRENLSRPERLLLTTFTKKAAESLGPRLAAALPFREGVGRVSVSTLHGLAFKILQGQKPDWGLADEAALEPLWKKAGAKAGVKNFAALASLAKNSPPALFGTDPAWAPADPAARRALERALAWYQRELAERRLWDFDDLILDADPGPNLWDAVLVDEFQDLSAAQWAFLQRLCPPDSQTLLTVIGDPDQSIYGFRGAMKNIFDQVAEPGEARINLSANYRSTKTIVAASESLWRGPGRPRRRALAGPGPKIVRASLATPKAEAAYVVDRIKAHLGVLGLGREGGGRQDQEAMPGLALADVAVLFRLRAAGRHVAEALTEAGLPWLMSGEEPLTAADGLDFAADNIKLLTMHAAKGLEFRLVFVIGVEDGLCPAAPPNGAEPERERLEEERRLFYVAVSRAEERLYLTRAARRKLHGRELPGRPSPFWSAPPPGLCLDVSPKTRRRPKAAPTLFD